MTQVQNIAINSTETIQPQAEEKQTVSLDEIVGNLVHQGLPQAFNPNNYLSKIAETYSISLADARSCLKAAIKELETMRAAEKKAPVAQVETKEPEVQKKEEVPFASSGFYYPNSTITIQAAKNDGMDNLNSFGSYNKLMFGIK